MISVFSAFGIAVALVEKGNEWPIKRYRIYLQKVIHDYMYWRFAQVLYCTVCCSFWAALVSDLVLLILTGHFMWPLTGFATLGFTWFVIELLNGLDEN